MTSVLLIYPFFKPRRDRSVFRFPPLGITYIAGSLRAAGYSVRVLDCTFEKNRNTALDKALVVQAEVVGIYCMVTMLEDSLWFASQLRQQSRLLVAGGPLPTCDPIPFLEKFDFVVRGEGEQTVIDLLEAHLQGSDLGAVPGIVYRKRAGNPGDDEIVYTKQRPFAKDLDRISFPARELLPNAAIYTVCKKEVRLFNHDCHEHARLSISLRVLQQCGFWRLLQGTLSGERG